MKLQEYLSQNDISPIEFGRRLGKKSPSTVYRYLNGERKPSNDTMEKIAQLTGFKVTPNDFFDGIIVPTNKHNTSHLA